MVLFFLLGMGMFFVGVSLPERETKLKAWLIPVGLLLWALGANPME